MTKAKETPAADLEKVSFEIAEGVTHTHAGQDYSEGDVIPLRRVQANRLVKAKKGKVVSTPKGAADE